MKDDTTPRMYWKMVLMPHYVTMTETASVVTTLTVHVPTWLTRPMTFQVDVARLLRVRLISRVGRDISTNPMSFDINNLGPGTATVSHD